MLELDHPGSMAPMHWLDRWTPALRWVALTFLAGLMGWMVLFSPHYQVAARALDHEAMSEEGLPPFGGDFLSEWLGGTLVRTGRADTLYDRAEVGRLQHDQALTGIAWPEHLADSYLGLFYPPVYYALVAPLSLLSPPNGAVVWVLLLWACLWAAWALLFARAPPRVQAVTLLATALFIPALAGLNMGQKGSLWLLLMVISGLLLRRGRPLAAGAVFALMALKPPLFVGLAALMALKGQGRFVAGMALTGLLLLAGTLLMGPEVLLDYARSATSGVDFALEADYPIIEERSWHGALIALGQATGTLHLTRPVSLVLMAGCLAIGLWVHRGPLRPQQPDFLLRWSTLAALVPLTSLKFLTYDLTLLLLPIWMLSAALARGLRRERLARVAGVDLALFWALTQTEALGAAGLVLCFAALLALLLGARPLVEAHAAP